MERKKFWYGADALRHASGAGLALLAAAAMVACGSDNSTGPARVHIPSSIAASAVGCGTVKVATDPGNKNSDSVDVQTYNLSATWQATGTWKAMFVDIGTGKTLATTAVDANQTKTTVIRNAAGAVTSQCQFKKDALAYAILFPDGDQPVASDADLTATITVGP